MQKPSIGRIVHVTVEPAYNNGSDIAPAVITAVWRDDLINARVIVDSSSMPLWYTSIPLVETEEEARAKAPSYSAAAFWPPRV